MSLKRSYNNDPSSIEREIVLTARVEVGRVVEGDGDLPMVVQAFKMMGEFLDQTGATHGS